MRDHDRNVTPALLPLHPAHDRSEGHVSQRQRAWGVAGRTLLLLVLLAAHAQGADVVRLEAPADASAPGDSPWGALQGHVELLTQHQTHLRPLPAPATQEVHQGTDQPPNIRHTALSDTRTSSLPRLTPCETHAGYSEGSQASIMTYKGQTLQGGSSGPPQQMGGKRSSGQREVAGRRACRELRTIQARDSTTPMTVGMRPRFHCTPRKLHLSCNMPEDTQMRDQSTGQEENTIRDEGSDTAGPRLAAAYKSAHWAGARHIWKGVLGSMPAARWSQVSLVTSSEWTWLAGVMALIAILAAAARLKIVHGRFKHHNTAAWLYCKIALAALRAVVLLHIAALQGTATLTLLGCQRQGAAFHLWNAKAIRISTLLAGLEHWQKIALARKIRSWRARQAVQAKALRRLKYVEAARTSTKQLGSTSTDRTVQVQHQGGPNSGWPSSRGPRPLNIPHDMYFEPQRSSLCWMHALNMALGGGTSKLQYLFLR